jgi:hypothetical protein
MIAARSTAASACCLLTISRCYVLNALQELQVTPQSVVASQQHFINSMCSSLSQHHSRALASWGVGPEELQAVSQLLQSEHVLKLGLTLLHFLYTR